MDELAPDFATLLLTYRRRQGLSQQEVATMANIYASDLSKWERGKKEPPRAQVILRLIDGFQLSHTEALEFVIAAGYSESILDRVKFDLSKYPPVEREIVEEKLQGAYGRWPVAELDTDGKVVAANLLAFRLWGALEETATAICQDRLLGENIFAILIRPENFKRINMPAKENDFWYTFLAVWNKLKETIPQSIVTTFEEVIEAQPILRLILRYGVVNVEREWMYHLDILPSDASPIDEPAAYLKFQIEAERIMNEEEHEGYLVSYRPLKLFTQKRVDQEYTRLLDAFGKEDFVQRKPDTHSSEEEEKYPSFFPAVHHDTFWMINFENREFIQLFDQIGAFRGKHYLEMLLSPQIFALMGGFDAQKLLLPIRQFLQQTKIYDSNERYEKIKARLLDHPAFQTLLKELWLAPSELSPQPAEGKPCFSVEVICPFTDAFRLSFDVIARQPSESEADYRITFVPTTNAAKAALILLRLQNDEYVLSAIGTTAYEQALWLLTVLKTVQEGFTKKKGKADWGWHPDQTFKKLHSALTAVTEHGAGTLTETMKSQMTWAFTQLLLDDEKSQEAMLTMLNCFVESFGEQAAYVHEFLPKSLPHIKEQTFHTL